MTHEHAQQREKKEKKKQEKKLQYAPCGEKSKEKKKAQGPEGGMGGKEAKTARREPSRLLHRPIHLLLCNQTQCGDGPSFELGCCEGIFEKAEALRANQRGD